MEKPIDSLLPEISLEGERIVQTPGEDRGGDRGAAGLGAIIKAKGA